MVAYLLVSAVLALFCLLLYVAAVPLAIKRRKELGPALVLAHAFVFPLALAGYAADIAGTGAWMPGWLWMAWLYPASFLIAAAACVAVMRADGRRWWLWPIPVWNLALAAILTLRLLTYLGVDCGIPGGALLMGHAMVQTVAAFPLYIFFPFFNPLPVMMLPIGPGHPRMRRINFAPAAATGLLLAVMVAVYPHAWSVTSSWRSAAVPVEPYSAGFQPGAVLRVSVSQATPPWQFSKETEAVNELGLAAVNLFVHDNLMSDQATTGALGEFLRGLREQGTTVILTADFPENWPKEGIGSREDILAVMGPFHEFLATEFQPDIMVPFIEPYGAFPIVTGQRFDADEWMVLLQAACERIHAAAPEVKCAVYFGQLEEDRLLYERVCAEGSPIDVTGFSIYTMFQPREELEGRLEAMTEWMALHGAGKPHWIFETGQSPLTMGGERAQAGFMATVMNWAVRQPEVDGLCVFSLGDYIERTGMLASGGRPRVAWHTVKAMKSEE